MKKKNIFKFVLAAALALIMVFGAAPLSGLADIDLPSLSLKAEAEGGTREGPLTFGEAYILIGQKGKYLYAITSCDKTASGEIVIPEMVDEKEVKAIQSGAFNGCAGITSVVIPKTVTVVSNSAFDECSTLTNITVSDDNNNYSSEGGVLFNKDKTTLIRCPEGITVSSYAVPDGVTSIDRGAFSKCTNLKEIIIPDSVTAIDGSAFFGCSSLENITLSNEIEKIDDGTFSGLSNLESVIIPEGVQHIGNKAFENCSSLKQISLPESLISIGSVYKGNPNDFSASEYFQYGRTFYGCTSLEEVKIPDNVEIIGYSTFYGCTSLSKVKLSKKLKEIAENTFYGCSSLKNIIIPKGVLEIGYSAFENCTSLENIELPDGLTAIGISVDHYFHTSGCYSFAGCTSLKEVVIPDSVTGIGSRAFSGCTSLSKVKLSNNLAIIDEGTFSGCTSLAEIVIPDSVTKIRGKSDSEYFGGAFIGCTSLSKVKLSNNLTEIGIYTFLGCTSLAEIDMPDSVTEIDWSAFKDCTSLSKVKLSNNLTKIENRVFSGCTSLKEIAIPDGVTEIDYSAFSGCTSLQEITIPDSVTTVYDTAFSNCTSLESITIGSGVENLGNGWIDSCRRLADITVSPENSSFSSVDGVLFNKDGSSLLAYPIGNKRSAYTIPDGVEKVGAKAFYGCRYIESLTIPASVTEIEASALGNCYDIRAVYYSGTREQWKEVVIGADNYMFALINVHCADDTDCTHEWGEWKVVEKATAEKEGLEKRTCSLCNAEETRKIPKLDIVKVTEIVLSDSEKTLTVGKSFTVTANVKPDDAFDRTVTWSSSDPSVATVDENGTVTAIAEGEVIITAESADGVKAECRVTVEKEKESFGKTLLNVITAPFRAIINLFKKLFGK